MFYAPTAINPSFLAAPNAIEVLAFSRYFGDFQTRFASAWTEAQQIDPALPDYEVQDINTDPAMVIGKAVSFLRLLDRGRVNAVYRSLLAQYADDTDLDAIAATRNILRLEIAPATQSAAAVMEGDAALLHRYLLSFDRGSAGSSGRYLFEVYSAWPQSNDRTAGVWDARVNGFDVHGRRGDVDVVIIGPQGAAPTSEQLALIRSTVGAAHIKPEAVSVAVIAAARIEYTVSLVLDVPNGASPELVAQDAEARVRAVSTDRILIGGEIPRDLLAGAAYGPNVLSVTDLNPVTVEPDPYSVPVLSNLSITARVR
ncbi:baseplate J/gp47 family protein [Labrenzia sp. R4_1]|uniref:baseplate J/gp47 family protein n=1 Tax=Labrenzia sp. R4_1 TaxID=2821106 RepID=UPI001ADB3FCF|nr:baseplate J/gp47 family protein [Labrenzia sp. R4_1]MBO9424691.1 baseplate J/gp47 family protein [Labrenzia sp. R4_1]